MNERSEPTAEVRYFAKGEINGINPKGWFYWFPSRPKIGPWNTEAIARDMARRDIRKGQ